MLVPVVAALAAAALYAVAGAFQHRSATDVLYAGSRRHGGLARFVGRTLHHPSWLIGAAADVVALALHTLALHRGPLALVQPLMVIGVVFALPLRHRLDHQRPAVAELVWAGVLTLGLAAFVLVATPATPSAAPADPVPALVTGTLVAVAMASCGYLGRAARGARAAACLGTAAGLAFAATAALTKASTDIATRHPIQLATTPPAYLLVAVGAGGLLLNQLAFQAGPLRASLPAVTAVDPVISLVIGIAVYDERLRSGPVAIAVEAVTLAAVVVATIALTRVGPPAGHGRDHRLLSSGPASPAAGGTAADSQRPPAGASPRARAGR